LQGLESNQPRQAYETRQPTIPMYIGIPCNDPTEVGNNRIRAKEKATRVRGPTWPILVSRRERPDATRYSVVYVRVSLYQRDARDFFV